MRVLRSIIFILFLVNGMVAGIFGQDPGIRHYTTSYGLPSNKVYQVYQDSRGFIWFATDAGAARFDGGNFKYFSRKDGLNTNEIIRIQEDSKGRIWFFNFNGTFNYYDGKIIYNQYNAPFIDDLKNSFFFKRMYEDSSQNLHFYHNLNRDIFILDKKNQVKKHQIPSKKTKRHPYDILFEAGNCLGLKRKGDNYLLFNAGGIYKTKDLSGPLQVIDTSFNIRRIFKTKGNICFADAIKYELKKDIIFKLEYDQKIDSFSFPFRKNNEILNDIIEDSEGNYWVSSHFSGIFCYDGDKLIRHFNISKPQNIMEDAYGNVWVSSLGEGVYKYHSCILNQNHISSQSFGGNGIISICERQDGGIWAIDGQRLYLLRDNKIIRSDINFAGSGIDQVAEFSNKTLIIGESNGYMHALRGLEIINSQIHSKKIISDNELVKKFSINSSNNEISSFLLHLIYRFDQENLFNEKGKYRIKSERFYATYYNSRNQLFVNGSKVYVFEDGLLQPYAPLSVFDGSIIRQHLNLSDDMELFNIGGDSLFLFDGQKTYDLNSAFIRSPEEQIIHLEYHDPYLFLAGNSRIFYCRDPIAVINGGQLILHTCDLYFSKINQILYHNNELIIASQDGISFLPLESLLNSRLNRPEPYFRNIMVNDIGISDLPTETRIYGKNKVQFLLGNIHYGEGRVLYSYMLYGEDKNWTTGSENSIVYSSLSPGRYQFRFKVRTGESEWSDEQVFEFLIRPYWWQHQLFYLFIVVIGACLVIIGFLLWKKRALKKQEAEHQILLLEQKALQSMMNPHFIFNALGSIQSYILKNKPADAGLYLSQFARLIRQNLNSTKTSMIELEEEIRRLRNYLELEQLRMNDRFSFSIIADDTVDEGVMIPTMILQPVLENAIWHGLSEIQSGGQINIHFTQLDEKTIKVTVTDNGIGVKKAALRASMKESHLKIGMELTRKRIKIIGNKMKVKTNIAVTEAFPGSENPGTRVEIIVPVNLRE